MVPRGLPMTRASSASHWSRLGATADRRAIAVACFENFPPLHFLRRFLLLGRPCNFRTLPAAQIITPQTTTNCTPAARTWRSFRSGRFKMGKCPRQKRKRRAFLAGPGGRLAVGKAKKSCPRNHRSRHRPPPGGLPAASWDAALTAAQRGQQRHDASNTVAATPSSTPG